MIVSQSQVLAMVRKAAVGSGLNAGVAIDLARAAVWLCAHGFDAVGSAVRALDGELAPTLARSDDGSAWVAERARVAVDARVGLDLIAAGAAPGGITYLAPDVPLVLVGAAAVTSREQGGAFVLRWDNSTSCVVSGGTVRGEIVTAAASVHVALAEADDADGPAIVPVDQIEVDAAQWERVSALAARTYVPSTEASRTAGAGAGLTDND